MKLGPAKPEGFVFPPLWPHTVLAPGLAGVAVLATLITPPEIDVVLALVAGAICIGSALTLAGRIRRGERDLREMDLRLLHSQKLAAIGELSAGIAHEINNPLGIVLQASQNLVQRTRPDFRKNLEAAEKIGLDMGLLDQYMKARKLDVFIEDIQSAASRASAIIRHMLDFSRRSESRRTVCDIRAIADSALDLASNDYDLKKSYDFKKIEIARDYDTSLPDIGCTATEIEQVLLNVFRNAAQAMA